MRARGSLRVRELTEDQRNEILTLAVERVYDYLRDRLGPGALQCVEVKAEITNSWPYTITIEAGVLAGYLGGDLDKLVEEAVDRALRDVEEELRRLGLAPSGER